MKYNYFAVSIGVGNYQTRCINSVISSDNPINTKTRIDEAIEEIKKMNKECDSIALLNLIPLESEEV